MIDSKIKHHFFQRLRLRETWIIFFILGIIMMNYPFLHIFNKPVVVLGFPLLYIYLTAGWGVSILVIYLFTKAISSDDKTSGDGNGEGA